MGFNTIRADARDTESLAEHPDLQGVGNVLCLTDNEDLNVLLCHRWAEVLDRRSVYCWRSRKGAEVVDQAFRQTVVWSTLPKPSLLSADLDRRRASLWTTELALRPADIPEGSLLLAGPGRVMFDTRSEPAATAGMTHALAMSRWGSPLAETLHPSLFLRHRSIGFDALLMEMIDRMIALVPRLPAEDLCKELSEREKLMPSSIGHGVAIPHAYSKAVSGHICALAHVSEGLPLRTLDDLPPKLIFLVIGPPGDPERHLALMADIARLVAADEARNHLLAAASFSDILKTVQRYTADIISE